MPVELTILAWSMVLLLVHIFAAAHVKTKQYGPKWNMGARDEKLPPLHPLAGRLVRAEANFKETLPIAIVALIGVVAADKTSEWTAMGGWIWLGARVVYLPLYAAGIPVVRTVIFLASLVGILIALWPLLTV
ncbi:MAPEG family protein [Sphingobium sp. 3R8]|uniref:Membrane protein n=1 Tax=Sphingomonas bisphenolicum TaxID=296544 RepID=A0ABM7G7J1_9SPHN|nr:MULTISPECIES: MAPEG family protein [Sphingomonadaceae]MBZ9648442.1 MAPEG family protein [Sphingobium sp. 3R8]BBF70849.1 membrane protein [Sphingomonas bisphenolicum]